MMLRHAREREREGPDEGNKKKKVATVKGKIWKEKQGSKERSCFSFSYLFICCCFFLFFFCSLVDPGLAEAGQKRQHTPPWQTQERLMPAALSWIRLNNTGPELGVLTGMYPPKEPRFIILRQSSNPACLFIYACTRQWMRLFYNPWKL